MLARGLDVERGLADPDARADPATGSFVERDNPARPGRRDPDRPVRSNTRAITAASSPSSWTTSICDAREKQP
jgi:hypothetical protein